MKKGTINYNLKDKKIELLFNYKLNAKELNNINCEYEIVGIMTIKEANNIIYKEDYDLYKDKTNNIKNINKSIIIDYDYYNDISNNIIKDNNKSNLTIYFKVKQYSNDNNEYEIYNSNEMYVEIPLSEKEINIKINEIEDNNKIIELKQKNNSKRFYALIVIILLAIITFFITYSVEYLSKKRI